MTTNIQFSKKKKKRHYQKTVGRRREECVAKVMKLIRRRQKQPPCVNWQEIGAVPASNSHSFEQTSTWNTHLIIKPQNHHKKTQMSQLKHCQETLIVG